ncbi:hypothetical protein ARMGADRAFT_1038269 [Armillaria gallica]|uniref:Uncharacterized protein n=1 Tax=Armillaria gallica TaxID=47427 RepID=A0A2H3D3S8_ARMGA|nr:hypothetical protein ARMGADRAFT_1038269 [Armillaria gallica]
MKPIHPCPWRAPNIALENALGPLSVHDFAMDRRIEAGWCFEVAEENDSRRYALRCQSFDDDNAGKITEKSTFRALVEIGKGTYHSSRCCPSLSKEQITYGTRIYADAKFRGTFQSLCWLLNTPFFCTFDCEAKRARHQLRNKYMVMRHFGPSTSSTLSRQRLASEGQDFWKIRKKPLMDAMYGRFFFSIGLPIPSTVGQQGQAFRVRLHRNAGGIIRLGGMARRISMLLHLLYLSFQRFPLSTDAGSLQEGTKTISVEFSSLVPADHSS